MEFLDFLMSWIGIFFASINNTSIGYFLSLVVVVGLAYSFYKIHTDKVNPLNLSDLFRDKTTHKISDSKFRLNGAFLVTSWAVIYSVLTGTSVEIVLGAYMTAWVFDRYNSRKAAVDKFKEGEVQDVDID